MPDQTRIYLHDMRPDQQGVIQEVHDDDPGFLRYLEQQGLVPGTAFRVVEFSPYDHIHYVRIAGGDEKVALGESVSAQILVEIES
jgi:Fe2+ transport system protein FeoA